ncbi:hypothetical protein [Microvirga sp. M2]|uniref:hypothetical protein n=1 Tax=Microvirga sp. M2 TaxID=3073270 RepID=UPI0039C39FE0
MKAATLMALAAILLAGCMEIEQTATVNPDGSILSTIEARVSRADYDRADPATRGTCEGLSGTRGKVAISSTSRFEGQSYVCTVTARIPRDPVGGVPWLDVTRLDGRRLLITSNPAGMIATSSIQGAEVLKEHRADLAGQSWKVSISAPRIEDTNGARVGQKASWDFSVVEVFEGAPIKGTNASATVSY